MRPRKSGSGRKNWTGPLLMYAVKDALAVCVEPWYPASMHSVKSDAGSYQHGVAGAQTLHALLSCFATSKFGNRSASIMNKFPQLAQTMF